MATTETLLAAEGSTSEGIVRALEGAGIDMVFGIIGGNMGRLYDALYDHQSTIRAVLVRHEQLASVMAEVYGRLTGRPGVAIGQGAFMLANAILGTLEAHMGSSPMLLLTDLSDQAPYSQHAPYQSGTGEYGSFDTRRALAGVTKYATVAHDPIQAVQSTQLAVKHALSGEPGPVAVIYHSAALFGTVRPDSRPTLYPTQRYLPARSHGDDAHVTAGLALGVAGTRRRTCTRRSAISLPEAMATTRTCSRTGRAVFPHPLSDEIAFAHGRLAVRCARRARPMPIGAHPRSARTSRPVRACGRATGAAACGPRPRPSPARSAP